MPTKKSPSRSRSASKSKSKKGTKKKRSTALKSKAKKKTKKRATKKRATKKKRAPKKAAAAKAATKKDINPAPMPDPAPMPEPMPGPEQECTTCSHMPVHAGGLVGVLVAIIAILSVALIGSSLIIDSQSHQINAANSHGGYVNSVIK